MKQNLKTLFLITTMMLISFTSLTSPIKVNAEFALDSNIKARKIYSDDPIEGVAVRATPGGSLVKRMAWDSKGKTLGNGVFANGNTYSPVLWNDGTRGYSASQYLEILSVLPKTEIIQPTPTVVASPFLPKVSVILGTDLNVRDGQGTGARILSVQKSGSTGSVVKTGQNVNGYLWKYIKWDKPGSNGIQEGWSVDLFLVDSKITTTLSDSKSGQDIKFVWMSEAGIPESDWSFVDTIVTRESGWNPKAVNQSSGACGLAQAYPCNKTGCSDSTDAVCSLKWQFGYVKNRYGGYQGAVNFWNTNHWY
jgi:Transglycosylase SLT domain